MAWTEGYVLRSGSVVRSMRPALVVHREYLVAVLGSSIAAPHVAYGVRYLSKRSLPMAPPPSGPLTPLRCSTGPSCEPPNRCSELCQPWPMSDVVKKIGLQRLQHQACSSNLSPSLTPIAKSESLFGVHHHPPLACGILSSPFYIIITTQPPSMVQTSNVVTISVATVAAAAVGMLQSARPPSSFK